MEDFDTVIVGGGIAGLEAARRIATAKPDSSICVIEKEDRLGGRLLTERFHGFRVPHGGSMIRDSDFRVKALCVELGLKIIPVAGNLQSQKPDFMNSMLADVATRSEGVSYVSVERFLRENYPVEQVDEFLRHSIYRDFLQSDISEFIRNYPASDLLQPEGLFNAPLVCQGGYGALVDRLIEKLRELSNVSVFTNTEVLSILPEWVLEVRQRNTLIRCKTLIWATGIESAACLPDSVRELVSSHICGVPFLRMAGYTDTDFTYEGVVGGLLGKLFPFRKGVFQLAYTEDRWANTLHHLMRETEDLGREETLKFINSILKQEVPDSNVKVVDYSWKYWPAGIHQFIRPITEDTQNQLYNPISGLYLIGEMIVRENKGWVEGALQSVDSLMELLQQ